MKIAYIANFKKLWDEEYIAQAFESLEHKVARITERDPQVIRQLEMFKPDVILWAKLNTPYALKIIDWSKKNNVKTVCWVWDLYWDYPREYVVKNKAPMFKADKVFTSDGGHDDKWKEMGIDHKCIRQGINEPECYAETSDKKYDVIFVGSFNRDNKERNDILRQVEKDFNLHWFGKLDSDEIRGTKLNRLFAESKIVIGDSVYSPNYWSNRVVETLGRGGFLIHQEVEGLKEAYPYLVTYKRGDYQDLKDKINFYLNNPEEREKIIYLNLKWVRENHLCKHRCEELCQNL